MADVVLPKLVWELTSRKSIAFENGILTFWGIPRVFMPYSFFSALQEHLFEKDPGITKDILYILGFIQAYNGTKILTNVFGVKTSDQFFHMVYEQSLMIGAGSVKEVKATGENSFTVRYEHSPIACEFSKAYGKQKNPIDHYLRGLISGSYQAWYGKNFVAIERQCQAQGYDECLFEIKEMSEWKNADELAKGQLMEDEQTLSKLMQLQSLKTLLANKKNA